MSKKRHRRRRRSPRPAKSRRPTGGIQLVTPEGDALTFTSGLYQHTALEEIREILIQAGDFGIEDDLEPEPDGSLSFPWFETRPDAPSTFEPIGQRVLAHLSLTPATLKVEAMSQQRLNDCHRRLEQLLAVCRRTGSGDPGCPYIVVSSGPLTRYVASLTIESAFSDKLLGDRIHLVETKIKSVDEALRERKPRAEPEEPLVLPPETIAEIEEKMLRQWIDDSIPALGGLTPREAVKTPEGRRRVLELIEHAGRMQERIKRMPGAFAPDYRKVKKMLGLE